MYHHCTVPFTVHVSMTLPFIVDNEVFCPLGLGQRKQTKPPLATVAKHPTEEYAFITL